MNRYGWEGVARDLVAKDFDRLRIGIDLNYIITVCQISQLIAIYIMNNENLLVINGVFSLAGGRLDQGKDNQNR